MLSCFTLLLLTETYRVEFSYGLSFLYVAVSQMVRGSAEAKVVAEQVEPKWCKLKKNGTLRRKPGPAPAHIEGYVRKCMNVHAIICHNFDSLCTQLLWFHGNW